MKRLALLVALALGVAELGAIGCNAILGNDPGMLSDDASLGDEGPSCPTGQKSCDGVCVAVNLPSSGCAGACTACAQPQNASAICLPTNDVFACSIGQCNAGFGDCDNDASDGCESLLTSKTSCGNCATNCVDEGKKYCSDLACSDTCNGTVCCGNAACASQTDPTGECVDTSTNPKNCGSCGHDCTAAAGAGSVTCTSGQCVVTSCAPGAALCNGTCLPDTNTQCGSACSDCTAAHEVCVGGSCQACSGSTFCGSTCCAENCCGARGATTCQAASCSGCSAGVGCGINCCMGSQQCCPDLTCATESDVSCGTSCTDCTLVTGSTCNLTTHACTVPSTTCSGPDQCSLPTGGCGCGPSVCTAATADPNCGACNNNCAGKSMCCCATSLGGDGGPATYDCQAKTGGSPDGGGGTCNCVFGG